MPYLIKGPVPTEAIGDCPWCDKKNTILHLTAAKIEGMLTGEYICVKCLGYLDAMREENREKAGALSFKLTNNPEVEVSGDE